MFAHQNCPKKNSKTVIQNLLTLVSCTFFFFKRLSVQPDYPMIAVMYICVFWTNNTGRLASISASHRANFTQFALSEDRLALGVSRVSVFLCADDCRGSPEGKVLLSSDRPYLTGGVSVARCVYQSLLSRSDWHTALSRSQYLLKLLSLGTFALWYNEGALPMDRRQNLFPTKSVLATLGRPVLWKKNWVGKTLPLMLYLGHHFKTITLKWRLEFRYLGGCVCPWPVNACICAWWGCFSI